MDNRIRQRLRAALQSWRDRASLIHDEDARDDEAGAHAALVELAEDDDILHCCGVLDLAPPLTRTKGRRSTPMGDALDPPDPDAWHFALPGRVVPSVIQSPRSARRLRTVFELAWEVVVPEWVQTLGPTRTEPPGSLYWLSEALGELPERGTAILNSLTQAASPPPKLGRKAKAVLKLLFGERAFDEKRACNLAKRAPTALDYPGAKAASTRVRYAEEGSSELRKVGLAQAAPRIGTWLTPEGKAEAERLFKR